jgi:hypothetical protein
LGGGTFRGPPGPSGELAWPGGAWQPLSPDPQTPPVDSQHHRCWSRISSVVPVVPGAGCFMQKSYAPMSHSPPPPGPPPLLGSAPAVPGSTSPITVYPNAIAPVAASDARRERRRRNRAGSRAVVAGLTVFMRRPVARVVAVTPGAHSGRRVATVSNGGISLCSIQSQVKVVPAQHRESSRSPHGTDQAFQCCSELLRKQIYVGCFAFHSYWPTRSNPGWSPRNSSE